MKSLWRSHSKLNYASVVWQQSGYFDRVSFAVRRPSLGQRIELTAKVRDLALKYEFLRSGDTDDQLNASLSELLVRRLYLEWGLVEVRGLKIDGNDACPLSLVDRGPEKLVDEIIEIIKAESGLTDDERKNS